MMSWNCVRSSTKCKIYGIYWLFPVHKVCHPVTERNEIGVTYVVLDKSILSASHFLVPFQRLTNSFLIISSSAECWLAYISSFPSFQIKKEMLFHSPAAWSMWDLKAKPEGLWELRIYFLPTLGWNSFTLLDLKASYLSAQYAIPSLLKAELLAFIVGVNSVSQFIKGDHFIKDKC